MSETKENAWPFTELPDDDGFDISSIFGESSGASEENPFEVIEKKPESIPEPIPFKPGKPAAQKEKNTPPNPIAAAFEAKTVENSQKGLCDKLPVFNHKGAKEKIEDPTMTFEELRIRKSEDFADLEEGKYVSWNVEYCGIRKEVKDPAGTTIISMKESIERSREFLEALKKARDKNPDCIIRPKVTMKNKGTASYKGVFASAEEARASEKVICLFPADDGRIYEMRKMEQGEFIAPKNKICEFKEVRAGFTPALPRIPMSLMGVLISFFRSFMTEHGDYEALALIYWDKQEKEFFAYVPEQTAKHEHVEASLIECPYDDDNRFIRYADIHSHNSMEAFFSAVDDKDERSTGLYLVMGRLDEFFPELKARIFCGDSFVDIDPSEVIEGLGREFPKEWSKRVTCVKEKPFSLKGVRHEISDRYPH